MNAGDDYYSTKAATLLFAYIAKKLLTLRIDGMHPASVVLGT